MLKSSMFLGRWGKVTEEVVGAHSAAMDGRGLAHGALSGRRRALPLGKRRGTYLSVIPKIPDSMQVLCFQPPMFCTF